MRPDGIAHTAFALGALGLGGWGLWNPKGTELHRLIGMLYVLSLFSVNAIALTIYRGDGSFGVFHLLAIVNLAILLVGFGAAFLRRPRGAWLPYHYYFMGWSYVGLCAAAGAEIGVRLPGVSLALGAGIPTIVVTIVGGSWVHLRSRATLDRVKHARGAA
ncbi:MAG: hypothetical protein ACHQXA_06135 [Gemmatimonadales bacterium]